MGVPVLTIGCKSDLEKCVPSGETARSIDPYSKLIEVSQLSDEGKRRMRKAFERIVSGLSVKLSTSSRVGSEYSIRRRCNWSLSDSMFASMVTKVDV